MQFLKVRRNAIIVTAIIIIICTFWGVHRSLGTEVRAINDLFYSGVDMDGYVHKSVASQLKERAKSANNLMSIGANYDSVQSEMDALRNSRNFLLELLEDQAGAKKLYCADTELQQTFDALAVKLAATASKKDAEYASELSAAMNNAAGVIENGGYNDAVRQFRREVLAVFPTNTLRIFSLVSSPELFE